MLIDVLGSCDSSMTDLIMMPLVQVDGRLWLHVPLGLATHKALAPGCVLRLHIQQLIHFMVSCRPDTKWNLMYHCWTLHLSII